MARKNSQDGLTRLELEIMKVLWDCGPATVQRVLEGLKTPQPLAYNTVQTVLTILHRKGKVKRETRERAYVYSPVVSRQSAAGQAVEDLVNRLFGGRPEALVLSMVRSRQLPAEKLAELRKLVEEEGHGEPE